MKITAIWKSFLLLLQVLSQNWNWTKPSRWRNGMVNAVGAAWWDRRGKELGETKQDGSPQGVELSSPRPFWFQWAAEVQRDDNELRQSWKRILKSSKSSGSLSGYCWSFTSEINPQLYVSRYQKEGKTCSKCWWNE